MKTKGEAQPKKKRKMQNVITLNVQIIFNNNQLMIADKKFHDVGKQLYLFTYKKFLWDEKMSSCISSLEKNKIIINE